MLKLFPINARMRMTMEWHGNRMAQSDPLWHDSVVPLRRIPFGFAMLRGRPATNEDIPKITHFLFEKFEILERSGQKINAIDLIDQALLEKLKMYGLKQKNIDYLFDTINGCTVPLSSSHGDLYVDNVIFLNRNMALIDWSLYKQRSTVVFDILHLPLRQICTEKGISWTEAIFFDIPEWRTVAKNVGLNINVLRMLYALDRTGREIEQNGGLKYSRPEKYIKPIMQLTSNSTEWRK
jgi:hypothetical protein